MLQKKEWLSKLARGNQHVLLTKNLLQLERIVSYRELEIAEMKETYRSRQERRISARDPRMQTFHHFYSLLNHASYL